MKNFIPFLYIVLVIFIPNITYADNKPVFCPSIDLLQIAPDRITVSAPDGWSGKATTWDGKAPSPLPDNYLQLLNIRILSGGGKHISGGYGVCTYENQHKVSVIISLTKNLPDDYVLYSFSQGSNSWPSLECGDVDSHEQPAGDCYFFNKNLVREKFEEK